MNDIRDIQDTIIVRDDDRRAGLILDLGVAARRVNQFDDGAPGHSIQGRRRLIAQQQTGTAH